MWVYLYFGTRDFDDNIIISNNILELDDLFAICLTDYNISITSFFLGLYYIVKYNNNIL